MSGQPNQVPTEAMKIDVPKSERTQEFEVTELPVDKGSVVELSSNTDTESCEAYISRTVELLDSVEPVITNPNDETPAEAKTSISDPVAITPGLNELIPEGHEPYVDPRVVFLDETDSVVGEPEDTGMDQNNAEFTEDTPDLAPASTPVAQSDQTAEERLEATVVTEQEGDQGLMDYRSQAENDSCFGMETDTGSVAGSTLAQALYCQKPPTTISCPPDSCNESSTPLQLEATGAAPLTSSNRLIIK